METEILEGLRKAIMECNSEGAKKWAEKVVEEETDPIRAFDAITSAMREVGDGFGRGELWLPDLVGAADAMLKAMPLLEKEVGRKGLKRKTLGTVVIGTVYGDIHTIGKIMVASLLTGEGFTVCDLGINIKAEEFVGATKKYKADILAISALMTTTASEQKKVIEALEKENLRQKVKVMVGGGAVTQEFADSIGADGYDATAPGAVKLARRLLGK